MTAADGHAGDARARQQALRTRCAHPTGIFERFEKSQVEQSIPARFERMVRRDPRRLALKTGSDALTYEALNQAANLRSPCAARPRARRLAAGRPAAS
jgi:hypothetical protein